VAHLTVEAHWAAVIAVAIHHDHWHRGLGMETAQLLLMLGFGQLRLHRIWAARSPCDSSSERLLRNTGMMEEGRIRHHVYAGDVWRDSITHVILEDEWLAHQIRRPSPTRYSARTRP
jgi:RimJ/RimL family protein N-acetyltransferase